MKTQIKEDNNCGATGCPEIGSSSRFSLAPVKKKFLKERQGARGRERREECNGRPEEGKE